MILLLLACADPPAPATEAAPPAWTDPTADDDWSDLVPAVTVAPTWTAAEVGEQIDRALSRGIPNPQRPLAIYRELLTHGDETCPGAAMADGFAVFGECTATTGYAYSGAAGLITDDSRVYAADGSWTGSVFVNTAPADYFITRPDGTRLSAGGTLNLNLSQDSGGLRWRHQISGTWQDDGDPGWLEDGFSGSLSISGNDLTDGNSQLSLTGSLTVLDAPIELRNLSLSPGPCPAGIQSGAIAVRQPDTSWFTLTFPNGCNVCGALQWQDGSDQGEACIDPAPLLAAFDDARSL